MPRKNPISFAILILLISGPMLIQAITFPFKPPPEHYYVDIAALIDPETLQDIDATASALLSEHKIPLYVVTIPSLSSQDAVTQTIEQYTAKLFNEWGIGWQDRNYGILLLISKGDRKARIELGADWGGEHDYQAKRIMDELIVPAFKRGDFGTGIKDGVRGLDALARGLDLPKPTTPWWFFPAVIGGFILIVAMIINLFKTGRSGWAWVLITLLGVVIFFIIKAVLSNSSSGSSSGFGGGSSGGGGATGSW